MVSGWKTYILVSLRIAFIRLGGKSSPIKVMGNGGCRQPNPLSFIFHRFGQRESEKRANDYHYWLVYLLQCRTARTALNFAFIAVE